MHLSQKITVMLEKLKNWKIIIEHFPFIPIIVFIIVMFHYFTKGNLLETIGVAFSLMGTLFYGYELFMGIYSAWLGPALGHNADLRTMGEWAVVTGATDGIGKAYAEQLAQLGINIFLLSRTEEKLKQVAQELSTKYGISTEIMTVDFTKGQEIYTDIKKRFRELDLEIGILINNVGICYPFPEYFLEIPNNEKFYQDILNCNILSVIMMTSIVLPGMVERRKGVVVNVGSTTSRINSPFMSLYGASKIFVEKLTSNLLLEYRDKGIIFQYIYPSYIATNLSRIKTTSWSIPSPEEFAKVAIKSIGIQGSGAIWVPHRIVCFCIKWGTLFRERFTADVSLWIWKGVWLLGKKNMMMKNKQSMNCKEE